MPLRFQRATAFAPALIAGLSLVGVALSPRSAGAQDLYVSSSGLAGQMNTDTIQVFDGRTGVSKGALATGENFSGLAFGPDGNLYANRTGGHTAFNPATGAVVRQYDIPGGVGRDLAFGPDGNFYVTDFRQVRRVDRVSGASSVLVNRNALGNTGGLTFASDGSLLVASTDFFNIQRFDAASGAFLGNFATGVTAYGLTFGSDNNLYVSSGSNNSILRYSGTTGALLGTFVAAGSGGLSQARDLAFGPDGNLYVASLGTDSVLRFNGTTGAFMDVFASGGGLDNPAYLTFGPAGAGDPPPGNAIPETGTLALLASGLLPLAGLLRHRARGRFTQI